jgi:IclR family transcriptional regulator, acetate operon repressor
VGIPGSGIHFSVVKNKPPYAIESVDHALVLAQLLQQEGSLRVTDAAERLGVSRSTAHRLLAMLVYRDFAEQTEDRRYRPGGVLRPADVSEAPVRLLRQVSLPHLHTLTERVQESTNLVVLAGNEVRFIATVECAQPLRVGDRVGRVLPAHLASGGKALLATMPAHEVAGLYEASGDDVDLPRLRRQLAMVRKRGFAINDQQTETGLTAVGLAVRDPYGQPCAAISIAMPRARFDRDQLPMWVGAISATVALVERDLAARPFEDSQP